MSSPSPGHDLLQLLQQIAMRSGGNLKTIRSMLPLNVALNAKTDFDKGVLACVAHVFDLVCQSPQGRQAVLDLGFQPFFQDIERPRHGGADD